MKKIKRGELLILDKDMPELIDEWKGVPAIWDAVGFKCDQYNEKGKYILTGSSVSVSDKIHHSGAMKITRNYDVKKANKMYFRF